LIRYLLLAALIYLAGLMLRRFLRGLVQQPAKRETDAGSGVPTVRCAHCGLFVPKTQALAAGDYHYCCEEHRRAGRSGP